jgi:hypothetical protein
MKHFAFDKTAKSWISWLTIPNWQAKAPSLSPSFTQQQLATWRMMMRVTISGPPQGCHEWHRHPDDFRPVTGTGGDLNPQNYRSQGVEFY